jgi:hypothetical protein
MQQGVGTMFFNLSKLEKGKLWRRLLVDSFFYFFNLKADNRKLQIWWDMKDNHKSDMDEFA